MNSFFFRTHSEWNDLPTELKAVTEADSFKVMLKKHFWDLMIDPD